MLIFVYACTLVNTPKVPNRLNNIRYCEKWQFAKYDIKLKVSHVVQMLV